MKLLFITLLNFSVLSQAHAFRYFELNCSSSTMPNIGQIIFFPEQDSEYRFQATLFNWGKAGNHVDVQSYHFFSGIYLLDVKNVYGSHIILMPETEAGDIFSYRTTTTLDEINLESSKETHQFFARLRDSPPDAYCVKLVK